MNPTVATLIEAYGFEPLPVEGTLFASTYRSSQSLPDGAPIGTAMIGLYAHEPLSRSLAGYELWFTGVRRDESPTRTNTPLVTWDEKNGLVKVNPVASWSFDQLVQYSEDNLLPVNPLLAQGYPSIGCAPCTRAVAPGEDPRAGRWSGTDKTECGLHV